MRSCDWSSDVCSSDLAVVGEDAEGLRQAPGREGVGRVALVEHHEIRGEAVVQQIGIERRELLGEEHALVADRAAGQRADVEVLYRFQLGSLLDAPARPEERRVWTEGVGTCSLWWY